MVGKKRMIKITIGTDGKDIFDSYEDKDLTLNECAIMVFRLEEIKQHLLSKEFKNKFEVKEGSFADE